MKICPGNIETAEGQQSHNNNSELMQEFCVTKKLVGEVLCSWYTAVIITALPVHIPSLLSRDIVLISTIHHTVVLLHAYLSLVQFSMKGQVFYG
jgi:hypothetical protein